MLLYLSLNKCFHMHETCYKKWNNLILQFVIKKTYFDLHWKYLKVLYLSYVILWVYCIL